MPPVCASGAGTVRVRLALAASPVDAPDDTALLLAQLSGYLASDAFELYNRTTLLRYAERSALVYDVSLVRSPSSSVTGTRSRSAAATESRTVAATATGTKTRNSGGSMSRSRSKTRTRSATRTKTRSSSVTRTKSPSKKRKLVV